MIINEEDKKQLSTTRSNLDSTKVFIRIFAELILSIIFAGQSKNFPENEEYSYTPRIFCHCPAICFM